jgi:hypothetical protein
VSVQVQVAAAVNVHADDQDHVNEAVATIVSTAVVLDVVLDVDLDIDGDGDVSAVFPGTGFRAALIRGVIMSFQLLSRSAW